MPKVASASLGAGWSSPVARQAHNLKVVGSNPTPATKNLQYSTRTTASAYVAQRVLLSRIAGILTLSEPDTSELQRQYRTNRADVLD